MAYVYGNTVHEKAVVYQKHSEREEQAVSRQVRRNRHRALHMSAEYVVFLAAATVVALAVCVSYLQLRSEITNRSRNIAAMQRELADLKEDNMTKYNSLLDSVNLEEVREKAMNEFGMVYASPDQVIKYKSPTSNEVTQYENIPESGVLTGLGKVKK